jgi:hypothetical protein
VCKGLSCLRNHTRIIKTRDTCESPKSILQKIVIFVPDSGIIGKLKNHTISIIDDILNPQSFYRFFALTVIFTFFGDDYFNFIKNAIYWWGR